MRCGAGGEPSRRPRRAGQAGGRGEAYRAIGTAAAGVAGSSSGPDGRLRERAGVRGGASVRLLLQSRDDEASTIRLIAARLGSSHPGSAGTHASAGHGFARSCGAELRVRPSTTLTSPVAQLAMAPCLATRHRRRRTATPYFHTVRIGSRCQFLPKNPAWKMDQVGFERFGMPHSAVRRSRQK
jgi:hypothetical protein